MSSQSQASAKPTPDQDLYVVLALSPSGALRAEYTLGGVTAKLALASSALALTIPELVAQLQAERLRQAERKRARDVELEAKRAARVWTGVALNHGVGFANRTVGASAMPRAVRAQVKAKAKANEIISSLALL